MLGTRHDDARQHGAHLPAEHADGAREQGTRLLYRKIVQQDGRGFAAQLQRAARDAFTANTGNAPTRERGAGEAHFVDARMAHQEIGRFTVARYQVDDASRETYRLGAFGDEVGLERRFGRRLHHHRAASQQRGPKLAGHDGVRNVPWRYRSYHAHRQATQQGDAVLRRCLRFERETLGHSHGVVEVRGAASHHEWRDMCQRTHLLVPCRSEFFFTGTQCRRQCFHLGNAFRRRKPRPRTLVEGATRRFYRGGHVRLAGFGHVGKHFLGVRAYQSDMPTGVRRHPPLAVDEELVGVLEAPALVGAVSGRHEQILGM